MELSAETALLGMAAVLVIGAIKNAWDWARLFERIGFTHQYMEHYRKLIGEQKRGTLDGETYGWLTMRVNRMQDEALW